MTIAYGRGVTFDVSEFTGFDWDAGNQAKSVAKHAVTPAEAEQVFLNQPLLVQADAKLSQTERRMCAWGQTTAGRLLAVVFTQRADKIRVISARPMSRKERTVYAQQS